MRPKFKSDRWLHHLLKTRFWLAQHFSAAITVFSSVSALAPWRPERVFNRRSLQNESLLLCLSFRVRARTSQDYLQEWERIGGRAPFQHRIGDRKSRGIQPLTRLKRFFPTPEHMSQPHIIKRAHMLHKKTASPQERR